MAIRDDSHHRDAVEMIDGLMQAEPLSQGQSDYLETWVELVENYEARQHAIDISNLAGTQMMRHVAEQSKMSGADLARLLGVHPTMGAKILSGERRVTWNHAKILAGRFKVDPALFMD